MKYGLLRLAFLMALIAGLTACGGGGDTPGVSGPADSMTITVSGPAGTTAATYTEGPYNTQGYLDPNLSSFVTPSGNTYISLCSGGSSTTCATIVSVAIKGSALQSYPTGTTGSPTQISYKTNDKIYSSVSPSASGTITLFGVGAVGEKISGAFDALVIGGTDTRGISGTFSVTREH